jgi:hypothetical protein
MADVGIRISAVDDTKGAFSSINRSMATLQSQASSITSSLAGLGVGLSVGAFVAFTKGIVDSLDALNDLKDATGASIENISALENIAKRTGTSFDTVGTALTKLNQALSSAKPGSDTELAIKAIGLSVADLKKLDPAEAFQKIAVSLNGFADDANKARLTQELFGKSLKEVAPLLKDVAEAGGLVATVTTEQAEAAEKLNKQLFAMQADSLAVARTFADAFIPTLATMAEEFNKVDLAGDSLAKTLGTGIKTVVETVAVLVANLSYVLKGLGREIGGIVAQLGALNDGGGIFSEEGRRAWVTVGDAMREDAEQARKDLEALEKRLLGIRDVSAQVQTTRSARDAADAGKGKPSVGNVAGPDKAAIAAANAELKKQLDLIESLKAEENGFTKSYAADMDLLGKAYQRGAISLAELVELDALLLAKQPGIIAAEKERTELEKARLAIIKTSVDANLANADSIAEALKKQEEENATIGATVAKLRELEQTKLNDALATAEQNLQDAIKANKSGEVLESITLQVEGLRKLIKAKKESYELADDAAVAKKAADAWTRAGEQMEQAITDGIFRGFENGKGFAENFADTLKSTFSTLILRPLVQGVVSGVTGQGGGGFGQAISTVQSAYNTGSALLQRGGTADLIGDKLYEFGDKLSTTTTGPLANFGSDLAANSSKLGKYAEQAGNALSYLEAASNFKDGSYGKSIGQAIGTYIGGPIAGQVGKALGELVDKLFSKGEYVQSTGEAGTSFSNLGLVTGQTSVRNSGGATQDSAAFKFTQGLNSSYIDTATKLGIKAAESFFYYGSNNSDGGKFRIGASIAGAGQVFDSQETSAKDGATQLAATRAVFAALQASDLPKYLAGAFDGLVASSLTSDQITEALNGAQALKNLHDNLLDMPFTELQDLSYEATKALIGFSGGIDQLSQNLSTYYDNFYTADEKLASSRSKIATRLNSAGGSFTAESIANLTRPAFRALVEQTDPSSPLYAALLSVAGAFAEITPVATAAADVTNNLADAAKKLADTNADLQDRLDLLTGTQTDRTLELRDATDDTTKALLRQIYAQEDLNAAAAKFADSIGNLSSTSFDLQNQILELQGNGAEVRQRVRTNNLKTLTEGLTDPAQIKAITEQYDYNEGLKDQIKALQDAAQAQEQAARAADDAARASDQLRQAWQSVTDTIFDEVRRIRNLNGGNSAQSFAAAQANFSITAAQASAGDQTAAKALPELSKILLELAETNATSLVQLQAIQGTTAGTLETIGKKFAAQFGLSVPQFSVGTNYVPQDMLALIHQGEAIVPAAYNPANGGAAGNDALIAEVQALRQQIAAMQAAADKTATATTSTAKTLDTVTRGGRAMQTEAFV